MTLILLFSSFDGGAFCRFAEGAEMSENSAFRFPLPFGISGEIQGVEA
jgi:hypothetical protein